MDGVAEAIRLVERQVAVHGARCVIVDDGCPDESSLMGTRDGYLNLALALLRFIADADADGCREEGEPYPWDDRVKDALYQIPTLSAWIVGAYLFPSHAEFMVELSRQVDPQVRLAVLNDPQFRDPALAGDHPDV
jgi:hypothetical protein